MCRPGSTTKQTVPSCETVKAWYRLVIRWLGENQVAAVTPAALPAAPTPNPLMLSPAARNDECRSPVMHQQARSSVFHLHIICLATIHSLSASLSASQVDVRPTPDHVPVLAHNGMALVRRMQLQYADTDAIKRLGRTGMQLTNWHVQG